jgi:asparagine synthase (glutamine-hydrolysing)
VELERLTRVMTYRAPDGLGTWQEPAVGLGHALFRTGTRGEQESPGVSHHIEAGLHIVADARLDGRSDLVRALRDAGVQTPQGAPRLDSPAPELIMAAWQAWGRRCPEHLLGDFAFALWDSRRRVLFAARDAFGVKPLFVSEVGGPDGALLISNTVPALLEHPDVTWEPDERSVADHLLWSAINDERHTPFATIRQVERGSWLEARVDAIEESRWWQLPEPGDPGSRRAADILEEFDDLLHQSVADRLPQEGQPALLQLSGGLDSGAIAAAAVEVRGGPAGLPALTFGYERLFADPEPALARKSAAALALDHTVLSVDDWASPLPGMEAHLPDWAGSYPAWPLAPGYDGAAPYEPAMVERARVSLTGWDGDAVLYADALGALGRGVRGGRPLRVLADAGRLARASASWGRPARIGLRSAIRQFASPSQPDVMAGYPLDWFDPDFESRLDLPAYWRATADAQARDPSDLRRLTRTTLEGPVWSDLFQSQDPGFTGQLIESRHPLVDLRLVRFFLALPVIPWCVEKGILRAWLRSRLPRQIWTRPKTALGGDPLILTLESRAKTKSGRRDLEDRFTLQPQDPLAMRRLLQKDWVNILLRPLEVDLVDPVKLYHGIRAHAVGRWLQRLEAPP